MGLIALVCSSVGEVKGLSLTWHRSPLAMATQEDKVENGDMEAQAQGSSPAKESPPDVDRRVRQLEEESRRLRLERDEALSASAVAECVKESLVELERQKTSLEEELATMQQLLNESHDEGSAARTQYEHRLAKAKALIEQLQVENQELKIHLKVGGDGGGGGGDSVLDRDTILGGAAVISDATKSFARRMKSNLLQTGVMQDKGQATSPMAGAAPAGGARATSPQGGVPSTNLEDGMRKAHEDTELLKSIVLPLEEQIGALKDKLRETDSLLRQQEERQSTALLGVEGMARWLEGRPVEEAMAQLVERSQSEDLGSDKEGRSPAQDAAYVALLSSRFSLLVGEMQALKREHREVVDLLDRERLAVRRLKHDAVVASSDMMRAQREHLAEVTRMQAMLTEEQKADLLSRQNSADLKELKSPPADSEAPKAAAVLGSAVAGGFSPAKSPVESVSSHTSTASGQSKEMPSKGAGEESDEEEEGITRIVSAVEWDSMQRELDKVRALLGVGAGDSVVGSDQYRALQAELIEMKKQKAQMGKTVEKLKQEARDEDGYRRQLEERWNERAESHRSETEALSRQMQELESVLEQVRLSYTTNYAGCRKDLQRLAEGREKIVRELRRLQEEVDILTGKHSAKAQEMQNEAINLPEKMEDMQLLLLRLREDTIAAKVSQERTEEKARAEAAFLKTQLRGEEEAKASIEDQYSAEIDQLKASLARLQGCQRELQLEQQRRREGEEREEEARKTAAAAKREAEAEGAAKRELEARSAEMRGRLTNLQQELDNSVAVQNDFVRLSQSLQVELEKIRQSEKEVRWQHEEDVNDCQGCKAPLVNSGGGLGSGSSPRHARRNKHHCRHCGRIFCSDCLSKTVASGPRQRANKVCEVCHTLLVQNSAPYFSTEAPQQN